MESWWQPIWRFTRQLVLVEALICAVCAILAWWRAWDIDSFGNAIVVAGLVLGGIGILPLLFRASSIRPCGPGSTGAFEGLDVAAQEGASMLPGGVDSLLKDDARRANSAIPSAMLLIAVAALSLVLAFLLSFL